jgi:hypothetical protein
MSVPYLAFTTQVIYINAVLKSRNLIIISITITTIFNSTTQLYSRRDVARIPAELWLIQPGP